MRINVTDFNPIIQQLQHEHEHTLALRSKSSITFRSPGRSANPAWANRFRKDNYDLNYEVRYSLIKGKGDMGAGAKTAGKNGGKEDNRHTSESISRVSLRASGKKINRTEMIKANLNHNPEKVTLREKVDEMAGNDQGLSPYEFKETILGRMMSRSNRHLVFETKPGRPSPQPSPLTRSLSQPLTPAAPLHRYHSFSSYQPHRVFEPAQTVDKFYNTQNGQRLVTAQRNRAHSISQTKIRTVQAPITAKLEYKSEQAWAKLGARVGVLPMSRVRREVSFTREVISPAKGCYR